MRTLREAVAEATELLRAAGADNPRLDARVLVAHAVAADPATTFLRADMTLSADQEAALAALLARRCARDPVARILGRREFWGLDFAVTPDTLDPRPETELVVEAARDHARRRAFGAPRILDLGTGTGCIALALLHALPGARAVATDISAAALQTARGNAVRLGLDARVAFVRAAWAAAVAGPFDVIVSNPPYLSAADMRALAPEVRFDPPLALDGGDDGLAAYRAIASDAGRVAARPAVMVLEVGAGQAAAVARMLADAGWRVVEIRPDLAGIPRAVVAEN